MFDRADNEEAQTRSTADERGASMVEYALLVVLIAIAGFLAVSTFGDEVSGTFSTIAGSIAGATN